MFWIGLGVGGCIGFAIAALIIAAHNDDDNHHKPA